MDTLSFFKKVLPTRGTWVLAELVPVPGRPKPGWRYQTFNALDTMVEAVAQLNAKHKDFYHACASYNDWYTDAKTNKKRLRTQDNVKQLRAIYDDIDVGKLNADGTLKSGCYADKKSAWAHVKAWVEATGMPAPMVVDSGGGLHLYWPLTEDVDSGKWLALSRLKRASMESFGLMSDPAINMDTARVLRPVGSFWRKNGEREVRLKQDAGPYDYDDLLAILTKYVGDNEVLVPRTNARAFEVSTDLVSTVYPEAYADIVAQHCAQIAHFRDTGGESEPEWYWSLGLVKHCEGGEAVVHEWSSKYAGCDPAEVQTKLDQWPYGPTTCDQFRKISAKRCEGCQHSVKSPIQLGQSAEAAPPVEQTAPPVIVAPEETVWPDGYRQLGDHLCYRHVEDDVVSWPPFAAPPFYPVTRIRQEDGTFALRMRMHVKAGQTREFDIPTKSIADGRSLKGAVGAYEVTIFNDKVALRYMADFLSSLRHQREQVETFTQFGWQFPEDAQPDTPPVGFLVGKTLITHNGPTPVRVSEERIKDPALHQLYRVKGTAAEWVEGVDTLYNRPGLEPYQYALATVFGSALVPLLGYEQWNGIPLALTSNDSGFGKSTVALIGINGLYNANRAMVADSTAKALVGRASCMGSLVVLFDEVTKSLSDAEELSDVLYSLSNGKPRIGMQSDGTERKSLPGWKLNTLLTGNRNIMFQLTEAKNTPEAMQMRVFEVDLQEYYGDKPPFSEAHKELALHLVNDVSGVLLEPFIGYILKNLPTVKERLHKAAVQIVAHLGDNSTKERFYAYHMACSLVGLWVASQLGFVKFKVGPVRDFAFAHIRKMRSKADDCRHTPHDTLSAMLSDLHGSVLITKRYEGLDARAGRTEVPMKELRAGAINGRLVLGDDTERGKLLLAVRAVDAWCKKNGISASQFKRQMEIDGLVRPHGNDFRAYLSKGVPAYPSGQCRCLEIDFEAAQGYIHGYVTEGNVVQMPRAAK